MTTTTKPYTAPSYIDLETFSDGPLAYADNLSFFDYYPPQNISNLERRLEIAFCLGVTQLVAGIEIAAGGFKWAATKLSFGYLDASAAKKAITRAAGNWTTATKEQFINLNPWRHPFGNDRIIPDPKQTPAEEAQIELLARRHHQCTEVLLG